MNHNDTMIKDERSLLYKNMYLSVYCKVWKGCVGFYCESELETEQNCNISYGRQRCVILVLQGCSTGGPEAHSARWCLSLLRLISNFSGPQLNRGPRAPSAWRGFPYHISSLTPTVTHQGLKEPLRPGVAFPTTSHLYNSNCLTFCLDRVI